jgi:hypothetical protein
MSARVMRRSRNRRITRLLSLVSVRLSSQPDLAPLHAAKLIERNATTRNTLYEQAKLPEVV